MQDEVQQVICPGPTFLQGSQGVWQGGAETTGGVLGGSNELWLFMTQHRKNSSRGKVTIRSDLLEQDAEEAHEPNFQRVPCPQISVV